VALNKYWATISTGHENTNQKIVKINFDKEVCKTEIV
jgi:hypothetical protein